MNNNEFRCDCVKMARAIKDEIDAEFATVNELYENLASHRLKSGSEISPSPAQK